MINSNSAHKEQIQHGDVFASIESNHCHPSYCIQPHLNEKPNLDAVSKKKWKRKRSNIMSEDKMRKNDKVEEKWIGDHGPAAQTITIF